MVQARMQMTVSEVVKVTSKGQFTLPVEIRRDLALEKDSYVYVTRLGRLIVMKKVDELSLDDISAVLQNLARKSGVTRRLLAREVERARERLHEEKHGRIQARRSH
jgi:bifunctional DNA-binding transcriptional regulator/antitoxin component of YhaV-PrlF toxin-antitoxin module